jgi:tRNA(Ile)-lysidine synthase
MDLLQSFNAFIAGEKLFSPGDKLLLTVSGGLDSVVLCELCQQAGFDFIMAHCNFRLRGAESDRDEAFVRQLAEKYERELLVKHFDTQGYAGEKKVSVQVAARELRYAWFGEIVQSGTAAPVGQSPAAPVRILTAHHLDDNIETLLMNFFRGTGIDGLHGILPRQGTLVRPLLFAWKEELRQFAETFRLKWAEDSSNRSDKYTRNYFRNQIIPLVSQMVPGALFNLAGNIQRFREAGELYHQAVQGHIKRLVEAHGNEVRIPVLKLKKTTPMPAIVYEIIRNYGFSPQQVNEAIGLMDSGSGRYIQSSTHRIVRHRGWLIIAPHPSAQAQTIVIASENDSPVYENGVLTLELRAVQAGETGVVPGKAGRGGEARGENNIALLDADSIQFPLLLRKWRQGDYFYPLGLRKKKKLARFFIDSRLSLTDKEKIWVIEMDKKIIWVAGMRIDDRFRITPQTRRILKIETRNA